MNPPKHIGESDRWQVQEIQWDKVPDNNKVSFEIINFWKMRNKQGWEDMWYCEFVAKVYSQIGDFCMPGDIVIMNLPYKSFERSIGAIPLNKKRFLRENIGMDNVYFEIEKKSRRRMNIYKIERRPEDPDMSLRAEELLYKEKE